MYDVCSNEREVRERQDAIRAIRAEPLTPNPLNHMSHIFPLTKMSANAEGSVWFATLAGHQ